MSGQELTQGELGKHPEIEQLFVDALYHGPDPDKAMVAIQAASELFEMLEDHAEEEND